MKKVVILFALLALVGCGTSDRFDIVLDLGRPVIVDVIPGDEAMTIVFQAKNDEDVFSGYNLYMTDIETEPTQRIILSDIQQIPTLDVSPSDRVETYSITISDETTDFFYNTNRGQEAVPIRLDLVNGSPYYFSVKAYNDVNSTPYENPTDKNDLDAFLSFPRPEFLGVTLTNGEELEFPSSGRERTTMDVRVYNDGTAYYLVPINDVRGFVRYAEDGLDSLSLAPTFGYGAFEMEVFPDALYLFRTPEVSYAKVYIVETNASGIVVDYAFQTSTNVESF